MQHACALRTGAIESSYAARARISLAYPGVSHMALLRLDRSGLAVHVTDDADLPPLGLPRQANVLSDDEPLCALRLVVRSIARCDEHGFDVVVQPSRADDHALFWQALRAHQLRYGGLLLEGSALSAWHLGAATARDERPAGVTCDAAFALPNHFDALFFADWLEYHFDEVAARARMALSRAELRELGTRVKNNEVEVRFGYWNGDRMAHACTDEVCGWIAAEIARLFALRAEHRRMDATPGPGLAMGAIGRAAGSTGAYSFSSK
ncbi:MAG TPA: hypothetical protein VGZ01_08765 [Trinickia sp.]|nr:hypothetical protein [Trinickia sp.]